MILRTERTTLRRFTDDDLDTVAGWLADPAFTRFIGGVRDRAGVEALLGRMAAHWADHGFGALAVTDRSTGELIGRSGAAYHVSWPQDPEVGWWIVPGRQGQGLATEAGAASVRWAFDELGFDRLVSIALEGNVTSRAVMAKLGFTLHERVPSEWGELMVHALDKSDM